jgi:hypothetical protein
MAGDVAAGAAATMTERPRGVPVAAIAGALFCVVLIYLALQIRAGADPAIGAGHQAAAQPAREVIVRRVILRRIVELPAAAGASPAGASGAVAAPPTGSGRTASAPARAPAAAPPAAAPPPAPVVSGAS